MNAMPRVIPMCPNMNMVEEEINAVKEVLVS
jgi:hypothetical protein